MIRKLIFGVVAVLVILGLGLTPGADAAERKDVLVIVEVKTRPTEDQALAAVGQQQRRRIVSAAHHWRKVYCDPKWTIHVLQWNRQEPEAGM